MALHCRYGGLSAYMYALHGFKVTSIELVPLDDVSRSLRQSAPNVRLVDADGRSAVLDAVQSAPANERLAVIFDGEKRLAAYETFRQSRGAPLYATICAPRHCTMRMPLHWQGILRWLQGCGREGLGP